MPKKKNDTFFSQGKIYRAHSHSRIDSILVPENLEADMESVGIGERILSVHAPVFVECVEWTDNLENKVWRLNNWLLESSGLEEQIQH